MARLRPGPILSPVFKVGPGALRGASFRRLCSAAARAVRTWRERCRSSRSRASESRASCRSLPRPTSALDADTDGEHGAHTAMKCHTPSALSVELRPAQSPAAPVRAWAGPAKALQLVGDAAPLRLLECAAGVAVGEFAQDSSAGAGGVQGCVDVFVEAGGFLDERDGGVACFGGSSLLGRESAAGAAAPPSRTARPGAVGDGERFPAARAGRDHWSRSTVSVQSATVRGCQRRCLPTRNPLGPSPFARQA